MALWQDVRYAARLLIKDRWFTIVAAVALALGIGVNATVFTFVNAVLLRGLPFDNPDRIMWAGTRDAQRQDRAMSILDYEDWRSRATLLDHLVLWQGFAFNVSDAGREPDRFQGVYISWDIFQAIGERPILGRDFLPEDDKPGSPPVVIISHNLWQSRYASDPAVIGRPVTTNGFTPTIIGVMPPELTFPAGNHLWIPLAHMPPGVKPMNRDARQFPVLARLKADVTREQAEAELTSIAAALADQFPDTNKDFRLASLMTFQERQNGGPIRLVFLLLMGAVGFVLLIACANVANLLLARAAHRSREISVRVSLGATRWRIVRQLLDRKRPAGGDQRRSRLRAVADWRAAVRRRHQGVGKPTWIHFTMDASVFAFLAAISSEHRHPVRPRAGAARVEDERQRRAEGGRPHRNRAASAPAAGRGALIVGELALTLVLLAGAGFMMRSFLNLYQAEIGVDTTPLLTASVSLPDRKYPGPEQRLTFYRQLEDRLNAIGAVEAATIANAGPGGGGAGRTLVIEARPPQDGAQLPVTTLITAGPRYFDTIGVRIIRGRPLNDTDGLAGQNNVVVNERFAALHFPGEDPIGRRIGFTPTAAKPPAAWMTIVGIAPNVRQRNMDQVEQDPVVYISYRFEPPLGIGILVRSRSAAAAVATVAARPRSARSTPICRSSRFGRWTESFAEQRWQYTVFGSMFAFFAFIALMLSAVGLYAVTAYSVTQRTQEIGVRMALGAQSSQVLWLFQRRILVQLAIGLVIGLAGAVGVGRLLRGVLVRTEPTDLPTLISIAALLVLVALAAGLWPARRATRLDPVAALAQRVAMTIENVRKICRALPEVTEDVKWGNDLCFCVSGKMFAAMDLNPPHSLGFKCTPDEFARARRAAWHRAGPVHGAQHVGAGGTARRSARPARAGTAAEDGVRAGGRAAAKVAAARRQRRAHPGSRAQARARKTPPLTRTPRYDASASARFFAVSMRPWTTAPSVMLTEGAAASPSTDAVSRRTMRVLAVILPLTCPATMIASAATVAET